LSALCIGVQLPWRACAVQRSRRHRCVRAAALFWLHAILGRCRCGAARLWGHSGTLPWCRGTAGLRCYTAALAFNCCCSVVRQQCRQPQLKQLTYALHCTGVPKQGCTATAEPCRRSTAPRPVLCRLRSRPFAAGHGTPLGPPSLRAVLLCIVLPQCCVSSVACSNITAAMTDVPLPRCCWCSCCSAAVADVQRAMAHGH
jgi:hypothetical protein